MASTSLSAAVLEAILEKRFSEFEDRTCLLFCQIVAGINNRIIKEQNIVTRHIQELRSRLYVLEHGDERLPVVPEDVDIRKHRTA